MIKLPLRLALSLTLATAFVSVSPVLSAQTPDGYLCFAVTDDATDSLHFNCTTPEGVKVTCAEWNGRMICVQNQDGAPCPALGPGFCF